MSKPPPIRLVDDQGRVVCARCELAGSAWARMRGLLGRDGLDEDAGMLIKRTSSIHTLFMRFPIDVVFLDRTLEVRKITRSLAPFRVTARPGFFGSVLELPAGAAARAGLEVGSHLAIAGAAPEPAPDDPPRTQAP